MPKTKTKTFLDLKKITRPLMSKLRYGFVALILSGFILADIFNIFFLISKGEVHHAYAEPSIEKLILSVFGAELSFMSGMDVQSVFGLRNDTPEVQENINRFGFILCLLPVLAAIIQACFRALDHNVAKITQFPLSSAIILLHNTFTLVYSIITLVLLADIAIFFIRAWRKERIHS